MIRIDKHIRDIAFFILFFIGLYTLSSTLIRGITINWNVYVGIGSLILCTFLYFTKHRLFQYLFVIILILGLGNVLQFTINIVSINFYFKFLRVINVQTVEIQVLSLLLILLHGFSYRKTILIVLQNLFLKSEKEIAEEEIRRVEVFERKFNVLSKKELETMRENKNSYSKEAIKAVNNLLLKYNQKSSI